MLIPEELPVRHASIDDLHVLAPSAFTLHVSGESAPIGRLELDTVITDQLTFDPVLKHPPHAVPAPPWLRELRRLAYEGSRAGRSTGLH